MKTKALLLKSKSSSDTEYETVLRESGIETEVVSVINIKLINIDLLTLKLNDDSYDGLVITSQRAVEAVHAAFNHLNADRRRAWEGKRAWVLGSRSSKALTSIIPSLSIKGSESKSSEALMQSMSADEDVSSKFLFPCSNLVISESFECNSSVIKMSKDKKLNIDPVVCYETGQSGDIEDRMMESITNMGINPNGDEQQVFLVFFSPSSFKFSVDALRKVFSVDQLKNLKCIAMGPSTRLEIQRFASVKFSEMGPKKRTGSSSLSSSAPPPKLNRTSTNFDDIDFVNADAKTKNGDQWNFKITTWNVDGLRACVNKGGIQFMELEKADVLCLQEIKCSKQKIPEEFQALKKLYPHQFWCPATKEGYAGTALLTKSEPLSVDIGLKAEEFDEEGRLITADMGDFYVVTTYVPNAGRKLVTLDKRMEWDPLLRSHLVKLDKIKPVVLCGDLNVAHNEIDLANPKTNKKNAGFTPEERQGMTDLLAEGFHDVFRHLYPEMTKAYTFWSYMMNARAKNVGWRLDYFVVSNRFREKLVDCIHRDQVYGSDHCPVSLLIHK